MVQSNFAKVVQSYYPNARASKDISIHYLGKMQMEHEIDISNVLLATSVCSDDINVASTSFFNSLLGPFVMGGLGGLPFVGKTGMAAYAHHIPDNGSAFIFYGPHIGITIDGTLGKMYRPKIKETGNSCGALMLALDRFKDESYLPREIEDDYQQTKLETSLLPFKNEILSSPNPSKAITEKAFNVIDQQIHTLLTHSKNHFQVDKVTLLGGIIINTDYGLDDYFDVRNFEVLNLQK